MTEVLDAMRQARQLLAFVARADRTGLSDTDLVALMFEEAATGRVLEASAIMTAADIAERSRYELGGDGLSMRFGERKPVNFIEQFTRVSAAEAARRVRVGSAVRSRASLLGEMLPPERPILAEALLDGRVGIDSAQSIVSCLELGSKGSAATIENMDAAEAALVELAGVESAGLVANAGRHWRDALDPDGIEPRYEEILKRQGVSISRERNGIKIYMIKAAPILAAELDAIFQDPMDKKVGPRFISDEDLARAKTETIDQNGESVVVTKDPRSLERKRADILTGVLEIALRATREGRTEHRTVGSVTAVIQLQDLLGGAGFGIVEGVDEVVPASVVQALACETGFNPAIVGNMGEPLYLGPLVRYGTKAQKLALVARDGDRCVAIGCRRKASESHAHHVVYASDGGPTDVDDLVMLCPAHHTALHQGAFEIKMVDGMPWIRSVVDAFNEDGWKPASRNRLFATVA